MGGKKKKAKGLEVQRKKTVHLLFKIRIPKRTFAVEQQKNSQKGEKTGSAERKIY